MEWIEEMRVYESSTHGFKYIHEYMKENYKACGSRRLIFQNSTMLFNGKDEIFETYKDAEEFLRHSPEAGRYYRKFDTAVRFLDYNCITPTKKMLDLKRWMDETVQKRADYAEKHSVKNFKADFVGCPGCGSKIARRFIHADKCPLCHKDLRSETTIKTINGYDEKIKDLKKQHDAEKKKNEKRNKKKADVMWLFFAQAYFA